MTEIKFGYKPLYPIYDTSILSELLPVIKSEIDKQIRDAVLLCAGISPDEFDKELPENSLSAKDLLLMSDRINNPRDDDYLARALIAERRVKELEKEVNKLKLQVLRRR